MNLKIKWFSIDIDGTLLFKKFRHRQEYISHITEENFKTLKEFILNGGNFIFATGRNLNNIFPYAHAIEKKINYKIPFFVSMNGAITYDNFKKKIIKESVFNKNIFEKIIDFLFKKKYFFVLQKTYINNDVVVDEVLLKKSKFFNKVLLKHYKNNVIKIFNTKPKFDNYHKITIIFKFPISVKIKKKLINIFGCDLNYFLAGKYAIEIVSKSTNKFFGISHLCEILKVSFQEFAAIGDQDNDYLSILKTGFGTAVDVNSKKYLKHIKDASDFITTNKKGEAVANCIKEMKLKRLI